MYIGISSYCVEITRSASNLKSALEMVRIKNDLFSAALSTVSEKDGIDRTILQIRKEHLYDPCKPHLVTEPIVLGDLTFNSVVALDPLQDLAEWLDKNAK